MSFTALSRRELLKAIAVAPVTGPFASERDAAASQRSTASLPLQVGIMSRHLQWTTAEEAIEVAKTAGYETIEWTVRTGGHIAPERVARELPQVVELTRNAGLSVPIISTAIQDASSPYAEAILAAAKEAGVQFYRCGQYFRYDYAKPIATQIDALKPRIASLVPLNQKYGLTWLYHTHSGTGNIGGNVWDIWGAVKEFDPAYVALNYDVGHTTIRGGNGWEEAARVAMTHIRGVGIKDPRWQRGGDGRWTPEFVPIGEGMADLIARFRVFKSGGFSGPVIVYFEHHNLLGTDVGTWTLPMPKAEFIAIIKQDLDRLRDSMRAAGAI